MANSRLLRLSPPNVAHIDRVAGHLHVKSVYGLWYWPWLLIYQARYLGMPSLGSVQFAITQPTMKLTASLGLVSLFLAFAAGQGAHESPNFPSCTAEMLRTDACAAVVNPNACYNQFRWTARTLTCVEGENDTERKQRVCESQGRRKTKLTAIRSANAATVSARSCATGPPAVDTVEEADNASHWRRITRMVQDWTVEFKRGW
jgi:hypothetical protein